MITEKILLRPDEGEKVTLTTYISYDGPELNMPPRPAILVCPGGGYGFCSEREAEPIAKCFFAAGFNCFILRYSLKEDAVDHRPLQDASRAIVHIRSHAEKYHIDPDKIFVVGFSAGGHLAASIGTLWHEEYAKASPDMEYGMNRPNGMILVYPVITAGPFAHRGSIANLSGTPEYTEEQMHLYSLEEHVDEKTAPAYICHTFTDRAVPVQNTLMFIEALAEHGIPFEAHVFPRGPHGFALANEKTNQGNPVEYPEVAQWIDEAIQWTRRQ